MARLVRQAHFKGTTRLLQLTRSLDRESRDELMEYIGLLERSQITLVRAIETLMEATTVEVPNPTACHFCHGQNCPKCRPEAQ